MYSKQRTYPKILLNKASKKLRVVKIRYRLISYVLFCHMILGSSRSRTVRKDVDKGEGLKTV